MSRASRKQASPTALQQIVDTGLLFAPPPVRRIASESLGSKLVLVAFLALLAKGVLSIGWQDGVPKLNVDREKAAELRQKITADLQERGSKLGYLGNEFQAGQNQGRDPWISSPAPPANHYYSQPSSPFPPVSPSYPQYPQASSPFPQAAAPYAPAAPTYPYQAFPPQGYPPNYGSPYAPGYGRY